MHEHLRKKPIVGHQRHNDKSTRVDDVYRLLSAAYGPQYWWPGDSKFEIMVGAVLTQNTAWINVEKAIANLKREQILSPKAIAETPPKRLAEWLRPSGYFNVKARRLKALCAWLVEGGGIRRLSALPTHALRTSLLAVHGVGPETADDILLYAFERPVFVVDAYTRRIFSRLGIVGAADHYEALRGMFEAQLGPDTRVFNEYHALIVAHGKNVCRPKPHCNRCCLAPMCRLTEST